MKKCASGRVSQSIPAAAAADGDRFAPRGARPAARALRAPAAGVPGRPAAPSCSERSACAPSSRYSTGKPACAQLVTEVSHRRQEQRGARLVRGDVLALGRDFGHPDAIEPGVELVERPARVVELVAEDDDQMAHPRSGQETLALSAAMRSSSGGCVMNSFFRPAALPPEMPKAAILSGNGAGLALHQALQRADHVLAARRGGRRPSRRGTRAAARSA